MPMDIGTSLDIHDMQVCDLHVADLASGVPICIGMTWWFEYPSIPKRNKLVKVFSAPTNSTAFYITSSIFDFAATQNL